MLRLARLAQRSRFYVHRMLLSASLRVPGTLSVLVSFMGNDTVTYARAIPSSNDSFIAPRRARSRPCDLTFSYVRLGTV